MALAAHCCHHHRWLLQAEADAEADSKTTAAKGKDQVDPFLRPHTMPQLPTAGGKPPRGVQGHQEAAQEAESSSTGGW